MSTRSALILAVVAALAGCQVDPTYIACQEDDNCPQGYFCGSWGFCAAGSSPGDAGVDAGTDAGPVDAGPEDAGVTDGGTRDDAGPSTDAGPGEDAGPPDAGGHDAGPGEDAGTSDAGGHDAGPGLPDAGGHDAGPGGATVPGEPTIGAATANVGQATISFTAPASNGGDPILSYTATSSPDNAQGTAVGSPITVTGLIGGVTYTFTVVATNAIGNSIPSQASNAVTPPTVPGAPTIGTASAGNGEAFVSFTPPMSTGGAFISDYTATSDPGNIRATAGASPITVTGLSNGASYTFTVVATNAVGNSLPSNPSNAVMPEPPAVDAGPPPDAGPRPDAGPPGACSTNAGGAPESQVNCPAGEVCSTSGFCAIPSYTNNGDGTVTDNVTGLVWQQTGPTTQVCWSASDQASSAQAYCNATGLPGTGWRVPSLAELYSLINVADSPAIDPTFFPGTERFYWAADAYTSPVVPSMTGGWLVDFDYYRNTWDYVCYEDNNYVRCVR